MRTFLCLLGLTSTLIGCRQDPAPIGKGNGQGTDTGAADTADTDTDSDTDTDADTDTPLPDRDGDGTHDGADCAPDDPEIHPGAEDIPYDGIDQDCSGGDLTDFDEDGYDAEIVGGSDCDDENPSVNPGALDEENDFDDDCDGEIDEDAPIIPTDWPVRFGGSDASTAVHKLTTAMDGTLWLAGTFEGLVDFEPTYERDNSAENASGTPDAFVASVGGDRVLGTLLTIEADSEGSVTPAGVHLDPGNTISVSATFSSTVDLDDSAREYTRQSVGSTDVVVARYNDLGDLSWGASFGGVGDDVAAGATRRELGGLFVAASVAGDIEVFGGGSATTGQGTTAELTATGQGDTDGVVVRYDGTGTPAWLAHFPASTTGEQVQPVGVVSTNDMVVVVGTFSGTIDLDPTAEGTSLVTAAGSSDVFIVALDPESGAALWSAVLASTDSASATSVAINDSNSVLVTGTFTGTVDLDPGAGDSSDAALGGTDGFAVSLDSAGHLHWSQTFGGSGDDTLSAGALDSTGTALLVGSFSDTVALDTGTLVSAGGTDCLALHRDATGALQWARAFGSADDEVCTAATISSDGFGYFSGPMTSSFDFSESGSDDLRRPSGFVDAWVHRLGTAL